MNTKLSSSRKRLILFYIAFAVAMLTTLVACGGSSSEKIPIGDTGVNITGVVVVDRFPPDCKQDSAACTMADKGSQYLVIWLDGELSYGSDVAYVTDSSGARYSVGNGLISGNNFLGQLVPESANGFTLHYQDADPIALGK